MADMKQVVQAIDTATGKIKSVYKKLTDIGNGMYAEAVAVNIDTVTVTDVGIKDPVSGNVAGVDVDGNLQVKGDVTATLTGSNLPLVAGIAEIGKVQVSGSNVEIGGVSFALSGGDTLRNTAVNKPNADAAHAAIPFCYYHAIDTGTVEATDGTNWVVI